MIVRSGGCMIVRRVYDNKEGRVYDSEEGV